MKEYKPGSAFNGVIGRTFDVSEPAWPEPLRAREGAPNVLYIVLDDTGFGQLGCFGSPINTPNIDQLADNGLRYTNMHTTALCSPTRSCIMNGRNHARTPWPALPKARRVPGSNGNIPFENGFLSEILLQQGYNTYAIGKWHLTPWIKFRLPGPTSVGRWAAASSFLWLSGRRDPPVLSGAGLRQSPGPSAQNT